MFNRDLIDLTMMAPALPLLRKAIAKAEQAYGQSILQDLDKAITHLQTRPDWMDRCMKTMAMTIPKAVLWKQVRALRRVLPARPETEHRPGSAYPRPVQAIALRS